jgi:hypothetical protein
MREDDACGYRNFYLCCKPEIIYPKCSFEQPDINPYIHSGVIFAEYQAYLDRQNKSKDGNNIKSEENNLTNKTPNRFAGLNHP